MEYQTSKKDTVDFKQIILKHYQKILDIGFKEFTSGYWNYTITKEGEHKTYVSDAREEYMQSVELLASALYPYFDDEMKKDYRIFLKRDKALEKRHLNKDGFVKKSDIAHTVKRLRLMKKLFRSISCLLHRLDYFKTAVYGEGVDNEVAEGDFDIEEDED